MLADEENEAQRSEVIYPGPGWGGHGASSGGARPRLLPAVFAPGQGLIPSFCRNHCLKSTHTPLGPGGFGKSASPSPGLSSWGAALTPADRPARGRGRGVDTGVGDPPSTPSPSSLSWLPTPTSAWWRNGWGPKSGFTASPAPWAPSQPHSIGARTRMNVFGSRLSP